MTNCGKEKQVDAVLTRRRETDAAVCDRAPAVHTEDTMGVDHALSDDGALAARLEAACAAFAAGDVASAVSAVRELAAREPDGGAASLLLCSFLLRLGDPEAGLLIQRCLARSRAPSPGWIAIGDALLERNQKEAALLCLGKAPMSAPLAIRCGLLARELGRLPEALDWLARAVRLDPESERGWFLLGACAQDARDFAGAAEAYRTVLRLNPARIEAEVNLGMVLQEAGDLGEAKRCYSRAVRARPDTFARVAQGLTGLPKGELWLDLAALRRALAG